MKLIVQIPAFNEESTLGQTIRDIPRRIDGFESVEVLVIDDGSSDATAEVARNAGANHVVRLTNHRGLSAAFSAGIDAALRLGADIIVNTDADNQYRGADIPKLIDPIVRGIAEVVIGDRDVARSPHMGPLKKFLQRFGSRAVGIASGMSVPDVTSGFRAFSRDAAYQINVFNPFTYTLETVIQAGNRNLGVRSVTVGTNAPTRASRLYRGVGSYLRKSIVTIFRIYTLYKPLKTFFFFGTLLFLAGVVLGGRFLYFFFTERSSGHVQSLILAAVFLIVGFQTVLIGLLADLISVNRRLSEEILIRIRKGQPNVQPKRTRDRETRRPERPERGAGVETAREPAAPSAAETQWVWLIDESELEEEAPAQTAPLATPDATTPEAGPRRRRRRRRHPGVRHFSQPIEHRHHADEE